MASRASSRHPTAHGRSELRQRRGLVVATSRKARLFGAALRVLRHERGLTQERAAELIGVHPVHMVRLEGGTANVTFATLVAIATAYRVSLSDLFAWDRSKA